MTEIAGKTVLITGGAQGIGFGIARAFAREGAKLAIVDVEHAALKTCKKEFSANTAIEAFEMDVRDRKAWEHVAGEVESKLGPVAILCNNAGIAGAFSIGQMSYALWDLVIGINLGGFINGVQTLLPHMIALCEQAHLVFTAAGAGLAASGGYTGYMYQTSKYAVVGMAESPHKQLEAAGHPIGVSILCPGPVPANQLETLRLALAKLPPGESPSPTEMESLAKLPPTERKAIEERLVAWNAFLAQGVPPERVGTMVVEAVKAKRLYIHTDRSMWDPIWARTKALLQDMPATPAVSTANLLGAEGFKR
jgi:NAD(P)-dependent dehydrogenase (short-subunit alcohol dehydrogenase family)